MLVNCVVPGLGKIGICCIYRPPCRQVDNINEFLLYMEELLESQGRNRLIIFGDFNLNTQKQNDSNVQRYVNLFNSYGLQN